MFEMSEKEKLAYKIAKKAHKGQFDKAGKEYINHPLHVAEHCKTENERVVALLHDVVEDTNITLSELSKYFDKDIVDAIDCITHREEMDYKSYLEKVNSNPIARAVKIQDVLHNMDLSRINKPTEKDYLRLEKYVMALKILCR